MRYLNTKLILMSVALILSATASFALPPCPASGYFNNCFGTYTYADGNKYVGDWKDDKKNGQGTFTFASGEKYVGEFKDGKRNGQGTNTYADGYKYVGEFKDDKRNGQGTTTYANGDKYVGEFKDDKRNGQGTFTYADGNKYVGDWKDNKKNGQGTYTFADSNKYVGEFKEGYYNGQGTFTYADGTKYVGEFKDDKKNGQGTFTFANGEKYVGEFKDDKMNGQGTATFASGDKYVGDWKDNKMNGQGTYTYADGTIEEGIWKDDDFLYAQKLSAPAPIESAAQTETDLATPKIKAIAAPEVEPVKPIWTLDDMLAAYNSQDYSVAKEIAEVLAVDGKAEAQLLLGKMYGTGMGALQVNTAAHMWFNIASMNGSDEAYEQRKAVTAQMTPSAVEKAQAMAMTCIQSAYTVCGLTVTPVASKAEPITKAETGVDSLKSHFKERSLLKRKQIQYALKKLGVYSSSVDGVWGNGTATAVSNYQNIQDMQTASPSELYASVLSKVEVPSSFSAPKSKASKKKAAPKAQQAKKPVYPDGWRSFSANPHYSLEQAKAICEPQAKMAGKQASSSYRSPSYGSSANCTGYGYSINCDINENSGGFWGGLADGLGQGLASRNAFDAVAKSCMAKYGWTKQ